MSVAYFNGLHLLGLLVLLASLFVCWAALDHTERTADRHDCASSGCTKEGTVVVPRHTGQLTWRCQGCADEYHAYAERMAQ